jgi:hypothetical protein
MTTPLHSTLKRALTIEGREYVVTLTNETLKVTLKGKRRGVELAWVNIVNGDAALAVALHASVGAFTPPKATNSTKKSKPAGSRSMKKLPSKK